jgi:hypothetical protein
MERDKTEQKGNSSNWDPLSYLTPPYNPESSQAVSQYQGILTHTNSRILIRILTSLNLNPQILHQFHLQTTG